MKEPAHLALHPFGQIPTYEEGDLGLFETGAIVFHIAQRHAGLLPDDANARARAITWMFAALSTVEPPILELGTARLLEGDKSWSAQRMPLVEDRVRNRLGQLSRRLGDADWLDGAFSAGDLMMVSVLLRLRASGLLDEYPNLSAYVARGERRDKPPAAWTPEQTVDFMLTRLEAGDFYILCPDNDVPRALDQRRMAAEASAFSTALARDLIDAGDFGAR